MIPFSTTDEQKIEVYKVAVSMHEAGLSNAFVTEAVQLSLEYEGAYELMKLWQEEDDHEERNEIVADLQDEIERHKESPTELFKAPRINFDELESNAKKVLELKKDLRAVVDRWGGISKLSRETGIPQPSLSRFFSSASFPRKVTIYRIVQALMPDNNLARNWDDAVSAEELVAQIWDTQSGTLGGMRRVLWDNLMTTKTKPNRPANLEKKK